MKEIFSIKNINLSISNVNKDVNAFIRQVNLYSKNDSYDQLLINRILDLFRFSNALLSDEGALNQQGYDAVKRLKIKKISTDNIEKKQKLLIESKILSKHIKKFKSIEELPLNQVYSEMRKHILSGNDVLKKSYSYFLRDNNVIDMNETMSIDAVLESHISQISDLIKVLIKNNNFQPDRLIESESESKRAVLFVSTNVKFIIQSWKYGNASVRKKDNKLILDAINSFAEGFEQTKMLLTSNRSVNSGLYMKQKIDKKIISSSNLRIQMQIVATYLSVSELLYEELLTTEITEIKKKSPYNGRLYFEKVHKWTQKLKFNVSVSKWVEFIIMLKDIVSHNAYSNGREVNIPSSPFIEIDRSVFDGFFTSNELNIFFEKLSLKHNHNGDIFDYPFIVADDKVYVLFLSFIISDPSIIILNLLLRKENKNDTFFQHERGKAFEKQILKMISINKLKDCAIETNVTGNKADSPELDMVFRGTDQSTIFLEEKTFNNPYNIKDYRYQIDKLISSKYIAHMQKNFKYFQNPKNSDRFTNNFDLSKVNKVFVSNIVIPKKMLNGLDILYLHYFEINRLAKGMPLNLIKNKVEKQKYTEIVDSNYLEIKEFSNNDLIGLKSKDPFFEHISNERWRLVSERSDRCNKLWSNGYISKVKKIDDQFEVSMYY